MKKIVSLLLTIAMVMSICCGFGISVSAAEPSIAFSYSRLTVSKGKSVMLKPKVSGVSDYTLVWSTSDKSIASVTDKGKVTGIKKGSAVVTVKIKDTDASESVKIYVGNRITAVTVDESSVTLKKGDKWKISTKISPTDAANKVLSYSTSNKKVAKVNAKGEITAAANGTAKITVKATDGSGKKAVVTVKVSSNATSSGKKKTSSSNEKTTGGFDKKKTSFDIVNDMKIGWNLGNSLDAIGNGMGSETAWGNPKTTKKMIDDIKAAGFNTVRIPVSWGRHTDAAGTVDESWMKRVKEVVDYAYDNDMYVILNSHHDNEYYDIGGCVSDEK
ncbi:MAG: cellulase family glycosylhydrolase, partial [Oscillospiraceae bacterium]|nr:cellulase family glycosylhydrolase [Oscillospiraceae bacterium]